MGLFRRRRRGDDGRFQAKDARRWRLLIRRAIHISRAPLADAIPLVDAAEACVRAVIPPAWARPDSIFVKLSRQGRAFGALPDVQRPAAAAELGQLAEACADALNRHATGGATSPPRADIFG